MSKKIGLLLPKSVLYPSVGFDILGGVRSSLADMGITDVEIKTEGIGLGADDDLIHSACEKMLFDGIGIVAGYVNPVSAEKLEPLFASAGAVFIALDAGYHFPTSTKKNDHVYYLSLLGGLCLRSNITGAVRGGKKNIGLAASFYDAGYRGPHAVHRGTESEGGTITFNFITPLKREDLTLNPVAEMLRQGGTDAVALAFCGDMLQDVFAAAAAGDIFKDCPLYGSSFAGDEVWLAKSKYPGADVKVCVPWGSGLSSAANANFLATLKEKKVNINMFSLLGWEVAQVAAHALLSDDARASLDDFEFTSPRGKVKLDAATHQCHASVYEATVTKNEENGNCILVMGGESPYASEQRVALEKDIDTMEGPMTSWQNVYACLES